MHYWQDKCKQYEKFVSDQALVVKRFDAENAALKTELSSFYCSSQEFATREKQRIKQNKVSF